VRVVPLPTSPYQGVYEGIGVAGLPIQTPRSNADALVTQARRAARRLSPDHRRPAPPFHPGGAPTTAPHAARGHRTLDRTSRMHRCGRRIGGVTVGVIRPPTLTSAVRTDRRWPQLASRPATDPPVHRRAGDVWGRPGRGPTDQRYDTPKGSSCVVELKIKRSVRDRPSSPTPPPGGVRTDGKPTSATDSEAISTPTGSEDLSYRRSNRPSHSR